MDSLFKQRVIASGVVAPAQWEYCLRLLRHRSGLEGSGRTSTQQSEDELLRSILIEQGALTQYQASQLYEGRHKLTLGPYIITDFIGQGGMGNVYKAVHQVMGRECAVKVLPLQKATSDALQGFMREIRLQAKLDCSYLVRAYDAGQDGKIHYLVTEYVPGMDLRRLVKTHGPLSQEKAAGIIMQAALGLEYAHQQGMVHRDVKPGNILVTPEGQAKVSDVGLAGFTANLLDDPRAGKIVGTADYLSPEQIRTPLDVGPASDVYSLGCTLYYAVCGKVPFPGGDTATKIRRHLDETPMHPRRFAAGLHDDFVDIIAEMMEKDLAKRMQTCAEVAVRLEQWVNEEPFAMAYPTMTRSPWTAPPPPTLESELAPLPDDTLQETSLSSHETNQSNAGSKRSIINPPLTVESADPTDKSNKISIGMAIALTAAVLLPPSILIGAVLGYLIAIRS